MEFHREMAARAGGNAFGNSLLLREEAREAWGWTWIERLSQDLRYATRVLRKSPGFTLAAVLMLAIGIGVNVAAFGFFNLLVLRPLAVRDPATLLRFQRRSPESYASVLPYPEMAFFRQYSRTLSAVIAVSPARLSIEDGQKPLEAEFVTANLFTELGAAPRLGRLLDPDRDSAPTADPVVVLGEAFWRSHFSADPLIVGKMIRLNGKLVTVIGVTRSDFSGLSLEQTSLWLPVTEQPYLVDGGHLLTDFSVEGAGVKMWGRLQRGVSPKAAEQELGSLAAELRKQHPQDIWNKETLRSEPGGFAKSITSNGHNGTGADPPDEMGPVTAMISALVLLILTVACGNLGSLLLARGVAREREIAIRVSVGAGRARLIRQLFTESLVLALLGSAVGLALGYAVLRSLLTLTEAPAWLDPSPDWRVALFAIAIGFVAAIFFGLTPALQIVRHRHRAPLLRHILLGAQVAGSCVLVIVAALLVRALNHAMSTSPGFEYQHVVSIDPGLTAHGYSPGAARAYLDALRTRLQGLPGIQSVSLASIPPLGRKTVSVGFELYGRRVEMHPNHVDPQFFQTMHIPLLAGRNFLPGDTHAIIISQGLARIWPQRDPLGRSFELDGAKYIVIGVCGDARITAPSNAEAVEAYLPADPSDLPSMTVQTRAAGPPDGLLPYIASIAKSVDPKIFPEIQLMKSSFREKLKSTEYSALAVGVLGFVALALACLGIVGLVAYAVSQRTKEIGIRMAFGAQPAQVLSIVLRQLSSPVLFGLVAGVGAAAAFPVSCGSNCTASAISIPSLILLRWESLPPRSRSLRFGRPAAPYEWTLCTPCVTNDANYWPIK